MKILQIHTSMSGGGIQSVVCALSNELAQMGEDVTVCSVSQPEKDDVFWNKLTPNVDKHTMGKKGGGFSFTILFKLYLYIRKGKFDVVNIHGFFCYYVVAIMLLHRKVKFFYTLHSDAFMENGKWDLRMMFLKKFCFRKKWIRPITISDASKESYLKMYACESTLVYNGIPRPIVNADVPDVVSKSRITAKTKAFVHVGRIDVPKNQVVLCKVFDRLIKEGNDVSLIIVGGKMVQSIYEEMSKYFSDRIIYAGERNDVTQIMSKCDAMCLPSIWEGMPMVLLESMAVGCVPICSPVGGIVNVIQNGENGFLSMSSDEDDYYMSIKEFLSQTSDTIKRIKVQAMSDFENFTINKTASKYLDAYKKL